MRHILQRGRKNPMSHVGTNIQNQVPNLEEVTVWLLSRIGEPVDRPQAVAVRVHPKTGVELPDVREPIQERIDGAFGEIPSLCLALAEGCYTLE